MVLGEAGWDPLAKRDWLMFSSSMQRVHTLQWLVTLSVHVLDASSIDRLREFPLKYTVPSICRTYRQKSAEMTPQERTRHCRLFSANYRKHMKSVLRGWRTTFNKHPSSAEKKGSLLCLSWKIIYWFLIFEWKNWLSIAQLIAFLNVPFLCFLFRLKKGNFNRKNSGDRPRIHSEVSLWWRKMLVVEQSSLICK